MSDMTATIEINQLTAIQSGLMTATIEQGLPTSSVTPMSLTATVDNLNFTATATAGMQGEPGSAAEEITGTAGENLSALRVVRAKTGGIFYASSAVADDADSVIGITTTSAGTGTSIKIKSFGELTDSSWAWTLGTGIYFNSASVLTQTAPSTGFVQQVATPVSATRINVNIKQAIILI